PPSWVRAPSERAANRRPRPGPDCTPGPRPPSRPRRDGNVDGVRRPLAGGGADRRVDPAQIEAVRAERLQRIGAGGDPVQRQLDRRVAVAPRALEVAYFRVSLPIGKRGISPAPPCATSTPPLRVRRSIDCSSTSGPLADVVSITTST